MAHESIEVRLGLVPQLIGHLPERGKGGGGGQGRGLRAAKHTWTLCTPLSVAHLSACRRNRQREWMPVTCNSKSSLLATVEARRCQVGRNEDVVVWAKLAKSLYRTLRTQVRLTNTEKQSLRPGLQLLYSTVHPIALFEGCWLPKCFKLLLYKPVPTYWLRNPTPCAVIVAQDLNY